MKVLTEPATSIGYGCMLFQSAAGIEQQEMKAESVVAPEVTKSEKQQETAAVSRSIWLASWLYELLPYFYILAGVVAIVSAVYVSRWYWAVPTVVVFGCLCVHTGFVVGRMRREHRQRKKGPGQ